MKKLWMRLGVTILATEEEIDKLLADVTDEWNAEKSKKVLLNILKEGRFAVDGNTYVPGTVIDSYNEENGTQFDSRMEPEWDL